MGESLQTLYDRYGAKVWFDIAPGELYPSHPFFIVEEIDEKYFRVMYENGNVSLMLKACEETNNYVISHKNTPSPKT
jgi:hypothetical protein